MNPNTRPQLKLSSGIKPSQNAINKRNDKQLLNEISTKFDVTKLSDFPAIERVESSCTSPQSSLHNLNSPMNDTSMNSSESKDSDLNEQEIVLERDTSTSSMSPVNTTFSKCTTQTVSSDKNSISVTESVIESVVVRKKLVELKPSRSISALKPLDGRDGSMKKTNDRGSSSSLRSGGNKEQRKPEPRGNMYTGKITGDDDWDETVSKMEANREQKNTNKEIEEQKEKMQKDYKASICVPTSNLHEMKDFADPLSKDSDDTLKIAIIKSIFSYGFEKPSPIQQTGIPAIVTRRDVIIQNQSGTGKTATFSIGVLQNVNWQKNNIQAIIISPTRELAEQTYKVISGLSQVFEKDSNNSEKTYKCSAVLTVGKRDMKECISEYNSLRPQIIVGTPGRILDMATPKGNRPLPTFDFSNACTLVLDEADQILSYGFLGQIQEIFRKLPKKVQIVLVSATLPTEIINLSEQFMLNPLRILVPENKVSLEGIRQYYVFLHSMDDKLNFLLDMYGQLSIGQTIIFVNSISILQNIETMLKDNGWPVSSIHSDCVDRPTIINQFRLGATRILLATDLVSRGIDVDGVSLVINFELPFDHEQYIHRIGRSGRYGKKGLALNLITKSEWTTIEQIKNKFGIKIDELPENFTSVLSTR